MWCEINPTRDRASAPPGSLTPDILAVPEVGLSKPARTRSNVVFPAPFGPKTARQSPGASEKVTPATARREPKERVSSATSTMGASLDEIVEDMRLELATLARAAQNAVSSKLRISDDNTPRQ